MRAMTDEMLEIFRRGANDTWNMGLTNTQLAQFAKFAEMLVDWNANRMNLTRLVSPYDIAVKHFLDSLALLRAVALPNNASLIDIGTGAGLPGIALKIVRPDLRITLLDSTAKKLTFCRAVCEELGLTEIQTLHARAEEAGRHPDHARNYQVAVARAVAPLERLLPWCAPFLALNGMAVFLKGASVAEEIPPARPVARRLGLNLLLPTSVILPESEEDLQRTILVAQKLPTS